MQLIRAGRDMRVDFFRGMALWWIFVDHIGANWLNKYTLHNFAVCDATDIFVLLAGYAAGIAYGRTLNRHGWLYAGADVLRRAWVLYIAHIFLFVLFTAQVSYSASVFGRAEYMGEIHLDMLGNDPYRALAEALILQFQPAYLNILPMYIMMLLFLVPVLPLLRRPRVLAALSFGVYAGARLLGWNLPAWNGGGWYFNPFAWQLLFMLGAILSYAPGAPPRPARLLDAGAALAVAAGFAKQWLLFRHPTLAAHLPAGVAGAIASIDKENMHPLRLVEILALAWLVSRAVPAGARWLRWRVAKPFVLCGQHSLPVFCGSVFLSFLGRLAFEETDGWWVQAGVNVAGAAALLGIALVAAWYAAKNRLVHKAALAGAQPGAAGRA